MSKADIRQNQANGLDRELESLLVLQPTLENDEWLACYWLPENFCGFQGHFEGHPVLPALMQVLIAQHCAKFIPGSRPELKGIGSAKFTEQGCPNELVLARITVGSASGKLSCALFHSPALAARPNPAVSLAGLGEIGWKALSQISLEY